jgi:hypothetical protein
MSFDFWPNGIERRFAFRIALRNLSGVQPVGSERLSAAMEPGEYSSERQSERGASGMNQTLDTLVSAQNTAQNGHYRRTQAYDFHH